MILKLPFPPSVNGYWRAFKGRQIISKKGREYRELVLSMLPQMEPMSTRLSVEIDFYPPDRRKRDLDNYTKAMLDALTHGNVWEDDEQIDLLIIARREVVKGGLMMVTIYEF